MRSLPVGRGRRMFATVAVLAAVAAGLAGCGDDPSDSSSESSPAPTASADSALADKVPDAIKADGKILVGTDSSYAPSEFLAEDGKTIQGFDVDLFTAVAQKLGLKAEFQTADFDAIIPGIGSGKYEVGVSSFTINAERKKTVDMVSYFNAGTQWATKKGNPEKLDIDNACGKKIAVQQGTVQVDDITARSKKCTDAGKKAITIDQYQGQDQATAAVVSGKDAATLADSPVAAYAVEQTNGQLELLGDIYEAAPYGYVLKKDQAEFAQAVADAVKALIADGSYKTILEKWGVEAGAITDPAVNP
ncbi:ABC transporter substrate-binding protein [Cryptosporangium aurantiacum]|uniref:Polar amino acid transport system substrate-binding protein n=1 Tax=Cryptosporangium aurantiacum TaxID=134849 RepID=A0A1M7ICL8_9ACTN|nr:ABC transporter substrate-binding protein [Cryptosporangium aurantiacum]SHM38521.1 polar amino acid transport system substrate-binding protein [Cryptosporangium aurantiacum]